MKKKLLHIFIDLAFFPLAIEMKRYYLVYRTVAVTNYEKDKK